VKDLPDYQRMYALLCGVVDDALDERNRIPDAASAAAKLQAALLDAEAMYIEMPCDWDRGAREQ